MKEFWIKIGEDLPLKVRENLIEFSPRYCNTLLFENDKSITIESNKLEICSKDESCDICFIEPFDENRISSLKALGKKIAVKIIIRKKEDEEIVEKAANLSSDYIILDCPDWKIIPLENIIAKTHGKSRLLAEVKSPKEAEIALKTLELGVDGIVLEASRSDDLIEISSIIKSSTLNIGLSEAQIMDTKPIGLGARVCIDTVDLMKKGEGMLVGSQSSGLFLIESETYESPFVETRPFRVNAGPVSLYILTSPNNTNYLSELKAGDEIMIVERNGKARMTNIGRVKIEWRPMMYIEAEAGGNLIKTVVQNAETIRLVNSNDSKSVTELKKGDKILVRLEEGGRHFGVKVEKETVIER